MTSIEIPLLAVRSLQRRVRRTENGCLIWTGEADKDGYGRIRVRDAAGKRRGYAAHRVAYQVHVGPVGPDDWICHACDTPPCVEPSHLFKGKAVDNIRDMDSKGRRRHCKTCACDQMFVDLRTVEPTPSSHT